MQCIGQSFHIFLWNCSTSCTVIVSSLGQTVTTLMVAVASGLVTPAVTMLTPTRRKVTSYHYLLTPFQWLLLSPRAKANVLTMDFSYPGVFADPLMHHGGFSPRGLPLALLPSGFAGLTFSLLKCQLIRETPLDIPYKIASLILHSLALCYFSSYQLSPICYKSIDCFLSTRCKLLGQGLDLFFQCLK